jgi:hypothetical protein
MTTNIIADDRSSPETTMSPTARSFPGAAEVLDDATIADLSAIKITHMTPDELMRVIRASRLPLLTAASDEHLEFTGRKTLELLVYLAQCCCRKRTSASRRDFLDTKQKPEGS